MLIARYRIIQTFPDGRELDLGAFPLPEAIEKSEDLLMPVILVREVYNDDGTKVELH